MSAPNRLASLCGFAAAALVSGRAWAQGPAADAPRPDPPEARKETDPRPARVGLGIEADVVPYILSGAHIDAWVGLSGWRARVIAVTFTAPSFFTPSGFDSLRTTTFEIEIDRFFGPHADEFRGPWVAAGGGLSLLSVDSSNGNGHGSTSAFELSTGVGWSFPLALNVYIDPWVGAGFQFTPSAMGVGEQTMHPSRFGPQLGLKVGWNFFL